MNKVFFNAFILGRRIFLVEFIIGIVFFVVMPLVLYRIVTSDSILLSFLLLAFTYPIYKMVFRKYVAFYTNGTYGIYLWIYGLKFGKEYPIPDLSHIYIYRTSFVGTAMTRQYGIPSRRTSWVVLELFNNQEQIVFPIYCSDEEYITQKALQLSKFFDLEIRDHRGRELEIYKA